MEETRLSPYAVAGTFVFVEVATILIAEVFRIINKKINQQDNLDIAFDAGGKVTTGLTATTIVSQWTWAATLLQSSAVASKYGISGPYWYAAGASIQILLFSAVSAKLKITAPGAKTFLQVVRARFGNNTHKLYIVYALVTNAIVTAMLMLGGAETIEALSTGCSTEMATLLCVGVIASYTLIGGLGATFYASYFNTALIFIGMIVFGFIVYLSGHVSKLGSIEKVYNLVTNVTGPAGNMEGSYLTMQSSSGLMFGVINIIGNFGTVFVDQAYWQSAIAAKPKEGVYGFLAGGLVWFSVPFTFATTMGLAYLALGAQNNGTSLLTDGQVNAGLVPSAVASTLGGTTGQMILLAMILMAVTSTGSAEVVAVASILVYDIHMIYIRPYRRNMDPRKCILCGALRGSHAGSINKCRCESVGVCRLCKVDNDQRDLIKRGMEPGYHCRNHGLYRSYMETIKLRKDWWLLVASIMIVPLTLILKAMTISLGWLYLFMGVLIGSAVAPVTFALFWKGLTAKGMMAGPIVGTFSALIAWLVTSSTFEGGLSNFMENTSQELSMLVGNVTSIVMGALVTVVVSLLDRKQLKIAESPDIIWESTLNIDNPLYPWTELYAKELNLSRPHRLDERPTLAAVEQRFKWVKNLAFAGSLLLTVILLVFWPAIAAATGVLSLSQFTVWVVVSLLWAFVAAAFVIIVPVVGEVREILGAYRTVGPVKTSAVAAVSLKP